MKKIASSETAEYPEVGVGMRYAKLVDASLLTHGELVLMVAVLAASTGRKIDATQTLENVFFNAMKHIYELRGVNGFVLSSMSELHLQKQKSATNAKKAAAARWDSRADKTLAKQKFDEWKSEKTHYKSKSDFSRVVQGECKSIDNPRTIMTWIREWERAIPTAK